MNYEILANVSTIWLLLSQVYVILIRIKSVIELKSQSISNGVKNGKRILCCSNDDQFR